MILHRRLKSNVFFAFSVLLLLLRPNLKTVEPFFGTTVVTVVHNHVSKSTDESFGEFFEIFWKNELAPNVEILVLDVFVHENISIEQTDEKHFDDNEDIMEDRRAASCCVRIDAAVIKERQDYRLDVHARKSQKTVLNCALLTKLASI